MPRLKSIQYLRAFAALMVVIAHAQLHPLNVADPAFVRLGSFAVILFFVISGFIMVAVTGRDQFDPRAFMIQRVKRVVPLYWLTTFAVAAIAILAPSLLKNTSFSLEALVRSCLFIPFRRSDGDIVPLMKLGWSLNYEMFFYLLFSLFFFMNALMRSLSVSLVLICLTLSGLFFSTSSTIFEFYTRPIVLSFVCGMLAGLWHSYFKQKEYRTGYHLPIACCCLMLSMMFIYFGFTVNLERTFNNLTDFFFTLAAVSLIIFGLTSEPMIPNLRIGLLLGDASYSLYLVHMYSVAVTIILIEKVAGWGLSMRLLPAVILSCGAAILVHFVVERPINSVLHRWARHSSFNKSVGQES